MKLAITIGALAFAAAAGTLGMTASAQAQPIPQGRYCVHARRTSGADDCYTSWNQCVRSAQPFGGFCMVQHRMAFRSDRYGRGMMDRS